MPLISVVTVVKDDAEGLHATLASLADQSIGDFEVIVADGGSQDDSLAVARDGAGLEVRVLEGPDGGIYDGMNKGWNAASGDYVWFVNAGDRLADRSTVASLVPLLTVPTDRWVYGAVRPVDEAGRSAGPVLLPEYSRHALEWKTVYMNHQGMLMERSLLEELGGFRTRFRLAAEYDLFLRAASITTPRRLDLVLVDFVVGGASFQQRERHLLEMAEARRDVLGLTGVSEIRNQAMTRYRILRTQAPVSRIPIVRTARDYYLKRRHGSASLD